jgi:hypothetical protein
MYFAFNGKRLNISPLNKLLRIMKLLIILLIVAFQASAIDGYAQRVTLNLKDVSLEKVF